MSFLLFWPANHLNSVLPLISLKNQNQCIKEQRTKNKEHESNRYKWCPSYYFGLQIFSTVFSLWSRWILFLLLVFLLYVWGGVVSSRCCCWVAWRYNGIPYIDSCPVPPAMDASWLYRPALVFLRRALVNAGARALVNLRWPPAQLPDLVQARRRAQNGLHILL